MSRFLVSAAFVFCVFANINSSIAGVVYTPTSGPKCIDHSSAHAGDWVCPGPGKVVARFSDEGNMAALAIGRAPMANKRLEQVTQFRGSGKVFGDKIEWHVVNGKPRSAVLRLWQIDMAHNDEREVQVLSVIAINDDAACEYAVVNVKEPDANAKAASHAEAATRWFCTEK